MVTEGTITSTHFGQLRRLTQEASFEVEFAEPIAFLTPEVSPCDMAKLEAELEHAYNVLRPGPDIVGVRFPIRGFHRCRRQSFPTRINRR